MRASACCIALVTAPDKRTARRIARAALKDRLAACVNLIADVESHYWWQGKLERGREVLLLFKTPRAKVSALRRRVLSLHIYETPEFVTMTLASGSRRYLDWIATSVA